MANNFLKKTWVLLKKIFFWVFLLHIAGFLYFIIRKFPVTDFTIAHLQTKVLIVCGCLLLLGLVYWKWLSKIAVIKRCALLLKEIFFVVYIFFMLNILSGMVFNPPITITQLANLVQGNGLKRDHISYQNMGTNIKLAVLASEDQLFPDHDGFDLKAIKLALKYNKRHPGKIRGASTISQQVAKNIFLYQGGGFFRKGIEVFFTFTIEQAWTKRIILARYLNVAEMGPGVFGVQAASKKYFNKDAIYLTRAEAAQIAACLPNPKKYSVNPLSNYVARRASYILRQMNNLESDPDIQNLIR